MNYLHRIRGTLIGAVAIAAVSVSVTAQEVTLRLHQFLPTPATIPAKILVPWAESVEKASGGRIEIQHFDAMSLGGGPRELMDQAKDGVVDIVMTVVGYTPGRFLRTEVFELPFMMTNPVATASAFWHMVDTEWQDGEYKDVKILGAWVHGPGVIHSKDAVTSLDDMKGKKLRGPTRVINDLLAELGATAVGMPVPALPENLSKGVINGAVIPWEVTAALRIPELVENHTEISGNEALYTATFVLAMNKAKYESMPADLRAILDDQSGPVLSRNAAQAMWDADAPARALAVKANNNIVTLDSEEVARWKKAAQPVIDRWVEEMKSKGVDGDALIKEAKALIAKHGG